MAVPTVVLDVLNSLKIASLPPQVNVGDRVDLGLSSPGLKAFDFLTQPPKLFDIELNNISLDNIGIDLTDISLEPVGAPGQERFQLTLDADNAPDAVPGATDLELVSKSVEFSPLSPSTGTKASDIETDEPSLHALRHQIPDLIPGLPDLVTSTDVKGLLSRITGTVRQVEKFTGSITGTIGTLSGHINGRITGTITNLKGSVKAPKLLESAPEVGVEWYIEDGNGKKLTRNTDFVTLDSTTLASPAASLMFLPVFAELSAGVDLIALRRIFCKVTVQVGPGEENKKERILGPVDIVLPKIQLPTILLMADQVMTEGGNPGAVLVAVPSQSLLTLDQLSDKLRAVEVVLNQFQTKLEEANVVLIPPETISQVVDFVDTIAQINRIIDLISNPNIRVPGFLKRDQVMDLWYVMREPPGFLGFGYQSWEDCITSLIMIGPPGRAARFYNAKNLWERLGAFEIVLGAKAVGHIDNLDASTPTCEPTGDGGCFQAKMGTSSIKLQQHHLVVSISSSSESLVRVFPNDSPVAIIASLKKGPAICWQR